MTCSISNGVGCTPAGRWQYSQACLARCRTLRASRGSISGGCSVASFQCFPCLRLQESHQITGLDVVVQFLQFARRNAAFLILCSEFVHACFVVTAKTELQDAPREGARQ